MITFCRITTAPEATWATGHATAQLDETLDAELRERHLLSIATGDEEACAPLAWVADPARVMELIDRDVAGWRISVRHRGSRIDVLDALCRSGAAFLRTDPAHLAEACDLAGLPTVSTTISVAVDTLDEAVAAVRGGAGDLVLDDWDADRIAALRDALVPDLLIERTVLPLGVDMDEARGQLTKDQLTAWMARTDGSGAARGRGPWAPGVDMEPPIPPRRMSAEWEDAGWIAAAPAESAAVLRPAIAAILERSLEGRPPSRDELEVLFGARGEEVDAIARVADILRARSCGDQVTYVINRNINYTNQCYFRCGFCGFSRGPKSLKMRDDPYILNIHEVVHRSVEAAERGATEVCLVGGIHPSFTGDFYANIVHAVKARLPDMHIHGFTPLEVWQGANTLGVTVREFLIRLRDAGLGTLPGTAAEILDDRVRAHLCPDKIRTSEWADVMITAHELGLRTTSTIMFGHIDGPSSWANHYEVLRQIQRRTGGFTEFVPLPFVHMGAPIFLQGKARPGPTWDEVVLIHAVARLAFDGLIDNIQASWVKLGLEGGRRLLQSGCNDIGGTLMNESISRASGASHGQLATPEELEETIRRAGRVPARRNTVYEILEPAT